MPLSNVKPQRDPQPSATPVYRPEPGEGGRLPGESDRAYELRKAMEATEGGDTRKDRRRY